MRKNTSIRGRNSVSIEQIVQQLRISFKTHATTCVVGQAGAGKTQVLRRAAIDFLRSEYKVGEDHYFYYLAPTKSSEYVGGIMMPDGEKCALKVPAWIFSIPNNSVVHLDEIDKLPLRDQMAWLQLLHEGAIDNYQLPPNIHWVLTANRQIDRGGSTGVNVLLNNRCRVFDFLPTSEEVLRYMAQSKFDFRVQAFLRENPDCINDYVPSRDRNPTSRSWEAVSNALKVLGDNASISDVVLTVAGSVPDDVAQKFQLYGELAEHLVPVSIVLGDPENAPMPKGGNRGLQLLQVTMVAAAAAGLLKNEKMTVTDPKTKKDKQINRGTAKAGAYKYASRFPNEFMMAVLPLLLMAAGDSDNPNAMAIPASLSAGDQMEISKLLKSHADLLKE